jgi:hypothetical protein
MITELKLKNVGPAPSMEVEFSPRLNIITGDNGLGKTFILDAVWFALTRTWAGESMFMPLGKGSRENPPRMDYAVVGKTGKQVSSQSDFDFDKQAWTGRAARPPMPGLVIYARIDGGFSVWDPARNYWRDRNPDAGDAETGIPGPGRERPRSFQFSKEQVWEGLQEPMGDGKREICNGLIRDVEPWRLRQNDAFKLLQEILEVLSPDDVERLKLGEGMRVSIDDVRDVPTLVLPYGAVPVTKAAAGMKRVLALSYLIVWAWEEHKIASKALQNEPTDRVVVIFDEVEAHLHPKWQRRFMPALVKVIESALLKDQGASTQFICTTHAPLVLGSVEPIWDPKADRLLDLDLDDDRQVVIDDDVPFEKHGTADSWLESTLFDLPSAYSREAEKEMARADAFMREHPDAKTAPRDEMQAINESLREVLGNDDEYFGFWRPYYRMAGGAQ